MVNVLAANELSWWPQYSDPAYTLDGARYLPYRTDSTGNPASVIWLGDAFKSQNTAIFDARSPRLHGYFFVGCSLAETEHGRGRVTTADSVDEEQLLCNKAS